MTIKHVVAIASISLSQALHYEKPPCASDEISGNIQGTNGTLCAPKCDAQGKCPTDVPPGTWNNATPACVLSDATSGEHYCALGCKLVGCPPGAHCAMIGIVAGVCVYPNGTRSDALLERSFVMEKPTLVAPQRPHLAQAWTAISKGDGLPNQAGVEHYIYEDAGDKHALQGHIFDYGPSCKKIELNTPSGYIGKETNYAWGTYYLGCDSVDCCYGGMGSIPQRPDVKKWDINNPSPITSVEFKGFEDTTELNGKPVKNAEHWHETDKLPLSHGMNVSYHHYITRNQDDIISHRIDFAAPGAEGSILYTNFTVVHNVTAFREIFKIPDMCYPQGSGRGHALNCDGNKVEEWEKKYFKHSHAMKSLESTVVV